MAGRAASSIGQRAVQTCRTLLRGGPPKLNAAQQSNLTRFLKKIPANSKKNVEVLYGSRDTIIFKTTSPGRVPGSRAVYQKTVDSRGITLKMTKETYAPDGRLVHIKDKF